MAEERKQRGRPTVGPEAPPTPWEAQQTGKGVPMAVANDMETIHGEGFVPTSAPLDPRGDAHYTDRGEGPDVRPKGPHTVLDNDDPKLMPLHAGEGHDDEQ